MPLTRTAGQPPASAAAPIMIAMDAWNWTTGTGMLRTEGVADCLIMILHVPNNTANLRKGAMAHLSWPKQSQGAGANPLNVLQNTVRIRDAMVTALGADPHAIEVYLWRGYGFGPSAALAGNAGNILDDLSWGHFGLVIDMMAHGDYGTQHDTTPFRGCGKVSYVPASNTAWFYP